MNYQNPCMVTAFTLDESRTITAYTLLHCYLEFSNLVPNKQDWSEKKLSGNLPRLYRFLQLNAMLRAFEFEDLTSFSSGLFIERNGVDQYTQAFAMISVEKITPDTAFPHYYFQTLLSYREKVGQLLYFGSDAYWICKTFPLVSQAYQKIWQFNGIIKENITTIDKILVAFISPEAKSFPVEDLIRDYDFTDVNISKLDMDELYGH